MRPNASSAVRAISIAEAALATSSLAQTAAPFSARTNSSVCAQSLMYAMTTRAPRLPKYRAYSCPIPRAAPVITMTFSSTFMAISPHRLFARQHLVHHLAGEPEIGGGVAHLLELRAREMPGDIGILRQQVDQRLPARRDLAANVVDEIVRPLTAEVRSEPHHDGFGHDHAAGEVEIGAHAIGVDLESGQHEPGLRERARGQQKDLRQRDPFDLPRAGRALVVSDGSFE